MGKELDLILESSLRTMMDLAHLKLLCNLNLQVVHNTTTS